MKKQKVKENFPVYATFSGTVTEKLVEQGDYIKQGQTHIKKLPISTQFGEILMCMKIRLTIFKKGQEVMITTNVILIKNLKVKLISLTQF